VIGFLLSWIPYVDEIGGLLVLIGVILVYSGRKGFYREHPTHAAWGMGLVLLSILSVIGLTLWLFFALEGITTVSSTGTVTVDTGALGGILQGFVFGAAVIGLIGAAGYATLPWALADGSTRNLLLAALLVQIAVTVLLAAYVLPILQTAVNYAIAHPGTNPVPGIDGDLDLLTVFQVLPAALFAWSYLRVRRVAIAVRAGARPGPGAPMRGLAR
jgi:hypothetical protein